MDDTFFMERAYSEAVKAFEDGEVPIGAVIVKDNIIIGRGYNRIEHLNDATAHAEILAIGAASQYLNTWRLNECTLYVTLEPCLMCLGAILQSRISRIVYAVSDSRYGAIDTMDYREKVTSSYRRFPDIEKGIMEAECKALIQSFFKYIRENPRNRKNI